MMTENLPKTPQQNIVWADTEIVKYRAKIADLEAYKRVEKDKIPTLFSPPAPVIDIIDGPAPLRHGAKKLTILGMLEASADGMRTPQIVAECVKRGLDGSTIANTSPQLSGYGKADPPLVRHDDGIWKITKAGRDYLAQKI